MVIIFHNITVYCIFIQKNVICVSIRYFFFKDLTIPKLLSYNVSCVQIFSIENKEKILIGKISLQYA